MTMPKPQADLLALIQLYGPCALTDLVPKMTCSRNLVFRSAKALLDSGHIRKAGFKQRQCSRAAMYAIGAGEPEDEDFAPRQHYTNGPISHPLLNAIKAQAGNPFACVMAQITQGVRV